MRNKVLIFCVLSMVLPICAATPTQDDLRQLENRLQAERLVERENQRKAAELSGEVSSVQKQMVQLAQSIQEKEASLSHLEEEQQRMSVRQKELENRLSLTEGQIVRLASGLQTLALHPAELAFLNANTPIHVMRSQTLMKYSLPVVGGISRQMRADLAELALVRSDLQQQVGRVRTTRAQLADRSEQMDRLLQQKSLLQAQYKVSQEQAQERVQALASQASDLKDLLTRLEIERKRQEERRRQEQMRATQAAVQKMKQTRPSFRLPSSGTILTPKRESMQGFAGAFGRLVWPIRGVITQNFGAETISGAHVKGMTLTGRANAQVVAPFDGAVLFAGPFKNYGQLLIIDNGDGYLTLLAGMSKLNPVVGQDVLAGEPIGLLRETRPELYVEIRKDGQPMDPAPWFSRG